MAKAASKSITKVSDLIQDPVVRAAFQRAELDYGQTFAIPDEPTEPQPAIQRRQPVLDGGAAAERELEAVS